MSRMRRSTRRRSPSSTPRPDRPAGGIAEGFLAPPVFGNAQLRVIRFRSGRRAPREGVAGQAARRARGCAARRVQLTLRKPRSYSDGIRKKPAWVLSGNSRVLLLNIGALGFQLTRSAKPSSRRGNRPPPGRKLPSEQEKVLQEVEQNFCHSQDGVPLPP